MDERSWTSVGTTAGLALLGAAIGGPLGAAVGALVGGVLVGRASAPEPPQDAKAPAMVRTEPAVEGEEEQQADAPQRGAPESTTPET